MLVTFEVNMLSTEKKIICLKHGDQSLFHDRLYKFLPCYGITNVHNHYPSYGAQIYRQAWSEKSKSKSQARTRLKKL
jgi:hypothetical protein